MEIEELQASFDEVHNILMDDYVLEGDFVLSSGVHSNVYVDVKSATTEYHFMTHALPLLDGFCEAFIPEHKNQIVLSGLESGALPLLTGLQIKYGWSICWVRKKGRDHGLRNDLIGYLHPDDKIIIVEDVLMSGAGINRVANIVGMDRVLGVVCVVNRHNLGDRINLTDGKTFEHKVVDVRSLFEMKHLQKKKE